MLISLTPVWNNDETIFDCLTALDNFVDRLVICEGKWIGYEGNVRSTDNTLQEILKFIKSAKHEVTYMMLPEPKHQYEVRNMMLNCVPNNDWFLIMDSDEIMERYPIPEKVKQLLNNDKKGYTVYTYDETQGDIVSGHRMDLPKILKKVEGLAYTKNHRYMEVNGQPLIYNSKDFPDLKEFCFQHHGAYKRTRQQAEDYKNWLINWEPYP